MTVLLWVVLIKKEYLVHDMTGSADDAGTGTLITSVYYDIFYFIQLSGWESIINYHIS